MRADACAVSIYLCVRRRSSLRLLMRCDNRSDSRGLIILLCASAREDDVFDGRVSDGGLVDCCRRKGAETVFCVLESQAQSFHFPVSRLGLEES